jgi:putative transposase
MSTLYRPKCKVMTKQWEPLTDPQWAAISPFLILHANEKLISERLSMPSYGCCVRGHSGATCPLRGRTGRPSIITAPAARFDQWKSTGTFERMNLALNQLDRKREDREVNPSVLCIDSQSVKLAPFICEYRGLDANKRVNAGPPVRPQTAVSR